MALDTIPPWLDVTPGQFVQAVERGNQTGLELAGLAQKGQLAADEMAQRREEAGAEQGLQQQKLAATLSEGAAERALKERLTQHAQELAQNKFMTGVQLREASQEIMKSRAQANAHAQAVQALLRERAENQAAARADATQKIREETLAEQKRYNDYRMGPKATRGAPLRETRKIADNPDDLFGAETTYSGAPEDVESAIAKRLGKGQPFTVHGAAEGGYKIGTVYKGLRYLGGPIKDETSWEPVK